MDRYGRHCHIVVNVCRIRRWMFDEMVKKWNRKENWDGRQGSQYHRRNRRKKENFLQWRLRSSEKRMFFFVCIANQLKQKASELFVTHFINSADRICCWWIAHFDWTSLQQILFSTTEVFNECILTVWFHRMKQEFLRKFSQRRKLLVLSMTLN